MRIEVLISAMDVDHIDFYKKFNLETDALIINQTDHNAYEEVDTGNFKVRMISTDTRGVARSRNLALLNSTADIIIFSDDDEVLEEGYSKSVRDAFEENPSVDFFIFKTIIYQDGAELVKVREEKDLSFYNILRYGAVHFTFRRKSLARKNIYLNTQFGPGTAIGSGEDSIFLMDSLRAGLRIRTNTDLIARVYNDESTWFEGFDEKYFYDKGRLARALFPRAYRLYIGYFISKSQEGLFDKVPRKKAFGLMLKGSKDSI